jgi:hypothetical protein
MIRAILLERKRKLLAKFETETVQSRADHEYRDRVKLGLSPKEFAKAYAQATREEQLHDLEKLWYAQRDDSSEFARHLVTLMDHLGNKYQVDELAAKYAFTGVTPLTIEEALEVKRLLAKIDELLQQLDEAQETAQIAIIDSMNWRDFDQTDMQAWRMQRDRNYIREKPNDGSRRPDGLSLPAYAFFKASCW